MIDMLKRHEIQVLRRAGHSQEEIADLAGVSVRSIRRVEGESPVSHVDNDAEREVRGIGRPSKAEPFRSLIVEHLTKEPHLLSLELVRRARLSGYKGGKSALYELIHSIRPKRIRLVTRFEGLPGEFSQHDFGEVDVDFLDGRKKRVHFFASRLKYSRWTEVSLVPDETVESLVRAMVDHFAVIGGIPLLAVFDRPKTIAVSSGRDGQVTQWNPTFAGVALDLGLGIELCWPRSPQQKGSVENLVGWVKGSFFKQRRFLDHEDLLRQLAEWLHEVNEQRPSRATGIVPTVRLEQERRRLRPPRVRPEELALRLPASVGPTAYLIHEGQPYSMPPEAAGLPATLYLYRDRVRIVAGRYEATHARRFGPPTSPSTLPEHRSGQLAAIHGKRGQRYLKRQHLLDTGEAAVAFLTEVVHRDPTGWIREVDRLHDLLQRHGPEAIDRAFRAALEVNRFDSLYVERCLGPVQRSLLSTEAA